MLTTRIDSALNVARDSFQEGSIVQVADNIAEKGRHGKVLGRRNAIFQHASQVDWAKGRAWSLGRVFKDSIVCV